MEVPNAAPYVPWHVTLAYVTWLKHSFQDAFRCISECSPPGFLLHYVDKDAVSAANDRSLEETMALIQQEDEDEYRTITHQPRYHLVQWWKDHVIGSTLKRYSSVGMTIIVLSEETRGIPAPVPRLPSVSCDSYDTYALDGHAICIEEEGDVDPRDVEYTERRRIMSDWTDTDLENIWKAVMEVPSPRPSQTYLVAGLEPASDTRDQAHWKKIRTAWEDTQKEQQRLQRPPSYLRASTSMASCIASAIANLTPPPPIQLPLPRPFIWRTQGEGDGSSGIDTNLWTARVGPLSGMLTHLESVYPEASIMVSAESPRYLVNAIVGELLSGPYRASNNRLGSLPRLFNLQFDLQKCGVSGGDRLLPRVLCGTASNHRGARQAFFAPVAMLSAMGLLSGRTTIPWGGGMELWTTVKASSGVTQRRGLHPEALPPLGTMPIHSEGYVWSDLWMSALYSKDIDAFSDMCRMEWPASAADAVHMAFIMLQDPIHRGVYLNGSSHLSTSTSSSSTPARIRPPVLVDVIRYMIATCACICWNNLEGKQWMEERVRLGDLPVSAKAVSVWLRAACTAICGKSDYSGVMAPLEEVPSDGKNTAIDADWEEEVIEIIEEEEEEEEEVVEIIVEQDDTPTKKRDRSNSLENPAKFKKPQGPRADQGLQFVSTPKQLHYALRIEARRLQWALNHVDHPVARGYPDPPSRYEADASGLSVWGWSQVSEDMSERLPQLAPYDSVLKTMGCGYNSEKDEQGRIVDTHHPYGRQLLWAFDDVGPLPYV